MKIFYITAEFDLQTKPLWLDEFRKKYDKPHPYHLTLKNATYIDDFKVTELNDQLSILISKYHSMDITFDKLVIDETSKGAVIMVLAELNSELISLQKRIHEQLSVFGEHIKESYKKYESEFTPHITIARHLDTEQLASAKQELLEPVICKAKIKEVVLTVVNEMVLEEMNDISNRSVYKLKV